MPMCIHHRRWVEGEVQTFNICSLEVHEIGSFGSNFTVETTVTAPRYDFPLLGLYTRLFA